MMNEELHETPEVHEAEPTPTPTPPPSPAVAPVPTPTPAPAASGVASTGVPAYAVVPPTAAAHAAKPRMPDKSPGLALFLSFIPGLGNIYNGLYLRGITHAVIFGSLLGLNVSAAHAGREEEMAFIIPSMVFFWFFNVIDAWRQAKLINLGITDEDRPWEGFPKPGGNLTLGVAMLVIGVYGILVKYFDVSMTWVLENWPLGVTAFGAWLVWKAWKQQAEESPADLDELR